jgi:hypothetical protein
MKVRNLSQDFCQSSILVRRINVNGGIVIVRQQFADRPNSLGQRLPITFFDPLCRRFRIDLGGLKL